LKLRITEINATLHRVSVEVPLLKEKIVTSVFFAAVDAEDPRSGDWR
jgi:hypothetical protein